MLNVDDYIADFSNHLKMEVGVELSNQLAASLKVITRDFIEIISNENGDLEKVILKIISSYNLQQIIN